MTAPQFLYSQRALIVRMCEAVGIHCPHVLKSDDEWKQDADAALARIANLYIRLADRERRLELVQHECDSRRSDAIPKRRLLDILGDR